MLNFDILFPSLLNGLTTGAVYALVALGFSQQRISRRTSRWKIAIHSLATLFLVT